MVLLSPAIHGTQLLAVLVVLLTTPRTCCYPATTADDAPADLGAHHMGWQCLRRSNASVRLKYPANAEIHFREVHDALALWTRNRPRPFTTRKYSGPRLENLWVAEGWHLYDARRSAGSNQSLTTAFGPFIPLLVNWVDVWNGNGKRYPPAFLPTLRRALRRDVPYVTVSTDTHGIAGQCEFNVAEEFPNLLVLSAGGYGHIPIPLLQQLQRPNNNLPVGKRKYFTAFLGAMDHGSVRPAMAEVVAKVGKQMHAVTAVHNKMPVWRSVFRESRTLLCPRGFGRTSYRLFEVLQMQQIPIYVYSDVPWLPFGELMRQMVYITQLRTLRSLLHRLHRLSSATLAAQEALIARHRLSHFTMPGVLRQILSFLAGSKHDLHCERLPPDLLGDGKCDWQNGNAP
eukprot:GGOE01040914.1.p1 GENE.GGOE01040914.1~~GGOE01040914.1.p1  ORF type:complete len:399 (-),score=81.55 GGOE01040914.1:245-1441(-)